VVWRPISSYFQCFLTKWVKNENMVLGTPTM
jgi:hypothetical protein